MWDIYVLRLKFEYGRIKFEDFKSFEKKHRRENARASFSDKPALPLVVLMKKFFLFFNSMRNLALKNKYFLHFRILLKAGRQASVGKGNFSHIIEASLKRAQRKQQEYNDIDCKISITETSCHSLP